MIKTNVLLIIAIFLYFPPVNAAELTLSCGAVGLELSLCREGAAAWSAASGHTVTVVSAPNSSNQRLALYQQLLAARSPDIDVFQIDVIWPGLLGEHFIDLAPLVGDDPAAHFPAIVANNTVNGRLVALPWFIDAGLLYYRADLLEKYALPVPATWAELATTAQTIQQAEGLWGYVFQGRAYEGLTCNALEWLVSHGGGTVLADDGRVTVNNPQAVAALAQAAGWIDTIAPPGVLNYAEEDARGVFQSGQAVFMRNWPYAWALAQSADSPVRGKVGVSVLPRSDAGAHAATLGGWQLAVSRYSRQPELAAELVRYLTGPVEQKRRAVKGSFNPTLTALYRDKQVLAANPFLAELYEVFATAIPRPAAVAGAQYNRVSNAFWNSVHSVLSGQTDAAAALAALENRLNRLSRGGRRW